jgi:hypothetical protein
MPVFALLSAGGSPGVTTAALALTLGWPSQVILAECDPSGGDVLAGLLGGHLSASAGLLPLALEAGAGSEIPADTLWRQLIELDEEHSRLLLAGISDPRQSAALQSSLPWIAEALQSAAADVIADCGRLDAVAAVRPVLAAASLAVLVLRPTLRQLSRAVSRIEMLTSLVGRDRVVALLVGDGSASAREVAKTLGVPVAGQLPDDVRTAAVLSDAQGSRSRLESRPLLRAAVAAGRALRQAAEAAGPLHGYAEQMIFSPSADHQPGLEQPGLGQPGLERAGADPYGLEPYGADPYSAQQYSADQYGADQYGADQYGAASQPGLAVYSPDQFSPEHYSADQYSANRVSPDQYSSSQVTPDQYSVDQPSRYQYSADQPSADQPSADQSGADLYGPDQPGIMTPDVITPGPGLPEFGQFSSGPFDLRQPEPEPGDVQYGSPQNGSTQYGSPQNGSRS